MSQKQSKQNYGITKFRKAVFETPTGRPVRTSGFEYIKYGDDNKYPQFLDNLLQQAEHNAILEGKVDWIAREGFNLDQLSQSQIDYLVENDLDTTIYKLAKDYETYGGFCFYVIRSRDGSSIARFEYEDFAKVRVSNDDETDDDEDSMLLVSDNWHKHRTHDVVKVPPFNPDGDESKSLYYFTGSSKEVYPSPRYYGAIAAIQTGIQIDNFHLNHVKNGFFIPLIINFNQGIPSPEQQDEIVADVKAAFAGTDNAGEPLVSFNNNAESAVSIESFEPADLDKKFEVLAAQVQQKILSGHRLTSPMLVGIKTEGQLGGRSELIDAWELFYNNYIKPTQNLLCNVFKGILGEEWNDLELVTIPPIEDTISSEEKVKHMTRAEIREELGLMDEDMTEQDEIIMKLHSLPPELRQAFIAKLTTEQLFELVGYNSNTQEIEDDEQL